MVKKGMVKKQANKKGALFITHLFY